MRAKVNRPSYLMLCTSGSRTSRPPRRAASRLADGDVNASSVVTDRRRAPRSNGRILDTRLTRVKVAAAPDGRRQEMTKTTELDWWRQESTKNIGMRFTTAQRRVNYPVSFDTWGSDVRAGSGKAVDDAIDLSRDLRGKANPRDRGSDRQGDS